LFAGKLTNDNTRTGSEPTRIKVTGCPVSPKQMREKKGLMAHQSSFITAKPKAGAL